MKLLTYLSEERGRATRLAASISVSNTTIHEWANEEKKVPVPRCTAIEQATSGAVTRKDLRPDDWHLIWPELASEAA